MCRGKRQIIQRFPRGILRSHIFSALLLSLIGVWNEGIAEREDHRGLICRLEVTSLEGKKIEIMELRNLGDGVFDLIYTKPYIEEREEPAAKPIATALRIANRSQSNPRLVELNSFNHGQPGAYFIRVKTSILTETTLGMVGYRHTSSTLVFRFTRALQDQYLNHRLIDEETYKMPLSSCQAR